MDILPIVSQAIRGFAVEWQVEPYHWLYEIDIQREIASRIVALLPSHARLIAGRHSHDRDAVRTFSRVTCGPYVKVKGFPRAIHPDIVVWSDSDEEEINSGRHHIDWACEIKSSFKDREYPLDESRLRGLLEERSQYAMQLIFVQDRSGVQGAIDEWCAGQFARWRIRSVT